MFLFLNAIKKVIYLVYVPMPYACYIYEVLYIYIYIYLSRIQSTTLKYKIILMTDKTISIYVLFNWLP